MKIINIIKDDTNIVSSFFIKFFEKINELRLNIFVAKADEYYSYDEPPIEKMKDKEFWIQIVRKEKEDK